MNGRGNPLYSKLIPDANFIVLYERKIQYPLSVLREFSKMDFKYKRFIGEIVTIFKLKYEKYMYHSGRVN